MIRRLLEWFSQVGPYDVPRDNYRRMKVAAKVLEPRLEKLTAARLVQEKIDAEIAAKEKVAELKRKVEAKAAAKAAREAKEREERESSS